MVLRKKPRRLTHVRRVLEENQKLHLQQHHASRHYQQRHHRRGIRSRSGELHGSRQGSRLRDWLPAGLRFPAWLPERLWLERQLYIPEELGHSELVPEWWEPDEPIADRGGGQSAARA